jgi:hypothetical protein
MRSHTSVVASLLLVFGLVGSGCALDPDDGTAGDDGKADDLAGGWEAEAEAIRAEYQQLLGSAADELTTRVAEVDAGSIDRAVLRQALVLFVGRIDDSAAYFAEFYNQGIAAGTAGLSPEAARRVEERLDWVAEATWNLAVLRLIVRGAALADDWTAMRPKVIRVLEAITTALAI